MDINSLPKDALGYIFKDMPVTDLGNVSLVCKTFNSTMDDQFWKSLIPQGCLTEKVNIRKFVLNRLVEDEEDLLNRINKFIETISPGCSKLFTCSFPREEDATFCLPVRPDVSIEIGKDPQEKIQCVFKKYFKPSSSCFKYYSDAHCNNPGVNTEGQNGIITDFSIEYFNVLHMLDLPCFRNEQQKQIEEKVKAFMKELNDILDATRDILEANNPDLSPELFSGMYDDVLLEDYPNEYNFTELQRKLAMILIGEESRRYAPCEINAMIVPEANDLVLELKTIQSNMVIINDLAEKVIYKLKNNNLHHISLKWAY